MTDIISISVSTDRALGRRRTVFDRRGGRAVSVRDAPGINIFVATLVARSRGIDITDWKTRDRRDSRQAVGSFYLNDDDSAEGR